MAGDLPDELLARLGASTGRALFVPSHFDLSDRAGILDFIARRPMAQIVSLLDGDIRITAAPLLHDPEADGGDASEVHFIGHIARRNPHAEALLSGGPGVALVQGPDAYISPRWAPETRILPTWSYVSVQLRGDFEAIRGRPATQAVLARTIARMERDLPEPWSLDEAPPELVASLLPHIVAFRFRVTEMQGIRRLNQNRKPTDRRGIIQGLRQRDDAGAQQIAKLMQQDLDQE